MGLFEKLFGPAGPAAQRGDHEKIRHTAHSPTAFTEGVTPAVRAVNEALSDRAGGPDFETTRDRVGEVLRAAIAFRSVAGSWRDRSGEPGTNALEEAAAQLVAAHADLLAVGLERVAHARAMRVAVDSADGQLLAYLASTLETAHMLAGNDGVLVTADAAAVGAMLSSEFDDDDGV